MMSTTTKRPTKLLTGFVVVAAASIVVGVAAAGKYETALPSSQVRIEGAGSVRLTGGMVAFGQVGSPTRIVATDEGGDGRLTIGGRRPLRLKRGTNAFAFRGGRVYIEGSKLTLTLVSPAIRLSVATVGKASFDGRGTYIVNGAGAQTWPVANVTVNFGPRPRPTVVAAPNPAATVRPPTTAANPPTTTAKPTTTAAAATTTTTARPATTASSTGTTTSTGSTTTTSTTGSTTTGTTTTTTTNGAGG